eukprot:TRINITY_DN4658_c0_g1_i1.p1 TRINITY_DN4658_c0_g1~~TRINITY_DN4658_c0_g1_i1.p1  ORF type:complete len:189 (+),score=31.30 TRINITY_DN4658_c0_g1_i1:123-689(+)
MASTMDVLRAASQLASSSLPHSVSRTCPPSSLSYSASLASLPSQLRGLSLGCSSSNASIPRLSPTCKASIALPSDTEPAAKAIQRMIRMSPSKVRRVIDQVRGRTYEDAIQILEFMPYRACEPVLQVLSSAAANAVNNLGYKKMDLYVSSCWVDEGPVLKRMRPRAQGRGYKIKKRTSKITINVKRKV